MKKTFPAVLVFFLLVTAMVSAQSGRQSADIVIKTRYGKMEIVLYRETPLHRENFIKLAKEGFFNGTLFHRVIKGFMIQGGDPWSKDTTRRADWGNGGPGYDIPAEILPGLYHKRGVLAAAREGDDINPERKSAGSQFYIVVGKVLTDEQLLKAETRIQNAGIKDFHFTQEQREVYKTEGGAPWLDQQYTIFGEVISGMEVADKIASFQKEETDKPSLDIKMKVKCKAKD